MFLCLLSALFAVPEVEWSIEQTEIFQPLERGEAKVSDDQDVYVLNFKEAQITRYDGEGELVTQIGSKGKGPGEMTYPTDFFLEGEDLYVLDRLSAEVSHFKQDGQFIARVSLPSRGMRLQRIPGGWLYGNWTILNVGHGEAPKEIGLYRADENFQKIALVKSLKSPGNPGGMRIEMTPAGATGVFNPISAMPICRISADGQYAFLSEAEGFEVHVIRLADNQLVQTIQRKERPIPFDSDWADQRYEEIREGMPSRDRQIDIKKDYPQYFPIIRDLIIGPNNRLVVNMWKGNPDQKPKLLTLDLSGTEVPNAFDWSVLERLIAIRDGAAWVTTFDADAEEAGISKLSVDDLDAFIQAHPIVYEGGGGRMIMIED